MKNVTTISGWAGLEPPDIRLKTQYLAALRKRFMRFIRFAMRGIGSRETQNLALRETQNLAPAKPTAWSLLALALLLIYCGPLLRWFDPTAAVIDIGALSLVLMAVLALAVFIAVSRWLLGLLWPVLRDYQRFHFSNNFKSLSPWQKITFYLVVFFGLLYAFVVCLVAVF